MSDSAPCMWMRGGTSKGGYFLASDLPEDTSERDAFLLRVMGAPDHRQIDGMGGADPDVKSCYCSGSSCGALLPSENESDLIDGIAVTCIDNGMPTVVLRAEDVGISGRESREVLEANATLVKKLETIRLQAGVLMNLGDVSQKSVPKMSMVSSPVNGGCISTRTFIPHRCHASIGVLGAVSVATACMLNGSPAYALSDIPEGPNKKIQIEHPSGETTVVLDINDDGEVTKAALLRTARKLFDGIVFAHNN